MTAERSPDKVDDEATADERRSRPFRSLTDMTSHERQAAQHDIDVHWPKQNRFPRP